MARQAISHFESYDWLGYFWVPGATPSDRFSGRVTYNPVDGVQFEVVLPAHDRSGESDVIHGVLSTGQLCTILCSFKKKHLGFVMAGAPLFVDKLWCDGIVLGRHFDSDQKFVGFGIDFTNFDEFCHPVDRNADLSYQEGAIQSESSADYSVVVFNKANLSLGERGESIFHSWNKDLLDEVRGFLGGLKAKYPNDSLMIKKSIGWGVDLGLPRGQTCEEIYSTVSSLESFLSLLIYMPVRRNEFSLTLGVSEQNEREVMLPALFSLFDMDGKKNEVLHQKQSHDELPFTLKTMNFAAACVRWLGLKDKSYLLPGMIASSFGAYSRHQIYADIILLLTELEGISMSLGKGGKYSLAMKKYANELVLNKLKDTSGKRDVEGVSEFLSDLRAEIAHVGKRRTILERLDSSKLLDICRCLKLIVASHILAEVDVSSSNIYNYQSVFIRG